MLNPFRTGPRLVWALSLIALLALILFVVSWCSERERGKQAGADRDLAQGRTASAVEAITEIGELGQRADATDAQVEEATNAIRQADPADRDRVARHRLCVLQHRADCDRLLGAGASHPDGGHAAR